MPPELTSDAARNEAIVADASVLGLIAFEGADTTTFLQGQLSNDVVALRPGTGQWTSYNSPKGRMLATLYLWQTADEGYAAIVAADLAEAVRKRLAMFVLRANVKVADLTASHHFLGLGGPGAASALERALGVAPAAGEVAKRDGFSAIHWPDGRIVVVTTARAFAATRDALAAHAKPGDAPAWDRLTVRAGVPMITAATQDRFVAQTANWDAIGGLDFRKGCYTGQEVVARTQHLGRLKERLFAFKSDGEPPAPGTRLFSETFGDQASGTVVNSAREARGSIFLAVAQIDAVAQGPLAIGAPGGPAATRTALPYEVPMLAASRSRLDA